MATTDIPTAKQDQADQRNVVRPMVWNFYLPDSDRNSGWSNHTYVLQHVCRGVGGTPAEAWRDADVPLGFHRPDTLVAVRDDHEVPFSTEEVS